MLLFFKIWYLEEKKQTIIALMSCSWFIINFWWIYIWAICRPIKNYYPLLPKPFFCRFCSKEWSKIMLEDKFFVLYDLWHLDSSINWYFQETDLSDTSDRYTTTNYDRLREFYTSPPHTFTIYIFRDFHQTKETWSPNEIQNFDSSMKMTWFYWSTDQPW